MEANHLINTNNSKMVAQINEAILNQKQVVYKNIFQLILIISAIESLNQSNLLMIIKCFALMNWLVNNKIFSVERMSSVLPTSKNFEFTAFHRFENQMPLLCQY